LANQQDAYYNLGNALYRSGQKTEQSAPQETLQKWTQAVKAYETALQLRANDADSKYNRDFVKRKIDALQQRQNQQQNPQQNPRQNPQQSQGQHGAQNNAPGQQAPPPQHGGGGQAAQPPQSAGQPPPAAAAGEPKRNELPRADPDPRADDDARAEDGERLPGQMSREEARELLDSAKGDERRAPLGAPLARRDADEPPEKPYKNW
jgi:Ca-activated chloride channel family protein